MKNLIWVLIALGIVYYVYTYLIKTPTKPTYNKNTHLPEFILQRIEADEQAVANTITNKKQ